MSKRSQYFKFILRGTVWGTILGTLSSIPFVYLYLFLWIYGYLGFLLSIIYGALIGLLNGIILGAFTFYHPASSEKTHRRQMAGFSIIVSVVGTYILFFPLTYPVFTIIPYPDYKAVVPPIAGYALCVSPIAFIAAFVASFAGTRIRYRGSELNLTNTLD